MAKSKKQEGKSRSSSGGTKKGGKSPVGGIVVVALMMTAGISYLNKDRIIDYIKEDRNPQTLAEIVRTPTKDYVKPDTTVNGKLALVNPLSVKRNVKDIRKLKSVEGIRNMFTVVFSNADKSQYLLAYDYEGDGGCSFGGFEIGYWKDQKLPRNKYTKLSDKSFATESGVRLGLSKDELIKIKGKHFDSKVKGQEEEIVYRIDDFGKSAFLKSYNLPAYYMKCILRKDKIVRIEYGFEYP